MGEQRSREPLQPVYVVDGARTPFLKARRGPGPFSASDLAVLAGRSLLARQPVAPEALDEVILGCASPAFDEPNIARVVSLRLGCGHQVPAWTVMRNCASGMQALDAAAGDIRLGRADLVLAGGTDALSRTPLLYSEAMVAWFAHMSAAKTAAQKAAMFLKLKPSALFAPVIGIVKGLTDPVVNLSMGQTAENLAWKFGLSRRELDVYSAESHHRALAWQDASLDSSEIVPLVDRDGRVYGRDDGVRSDSRPERLARLAPVFDRRYGRITAGNSSQITDGAAMLLLASEAAVERWRLEPIGRIIDAEWAGLDPAQMGLGPVHATTPILRRQQLDIDALDAWEINEAFAAQVLACLAAWNDDAYCREMLGLEKALGVLDRAKLNKDGGAIALGHPVGATGARIVLHLLHVLKRDGGRRGIATLCIGGGQGGAMLVETTS